MNCFDDIERKYFIYDDSGEWLGISSDSSYCDDSVEMIYRRKCAEEEYQHKVAPRRQIEDDARDRLYRDWDYLD